MGGPTCSHKVIRRAETATFCPWWRVEVRALSRVQNNTRRWAGRAVPGREQEENGKGLNSARLFWKTEECGNTPRVGPCNSGPGQCAGTLDGQSSRLAAGTPAWQLAGIFLAWPLSSVAVSPQDFQRL